MTDTTPIDADILAERVDSALMLSGQQQEPARLDVGTLIQIRDMLRELAAGRGMVDPTPPTRPTAPPLSAGPAHYRMAQQLLEAADHPQRWITGADPDAFPEWKTGAFHVTPEWTPPDLTPTLLSALTHAVLAKVALDAETRVDTLGDKLARRPAPADPDIGEPARYGTPWGRALYGDLTTQPEGDPT